MKIPPLTLVISALLPQLALGQGISAHDEERARTLDQLIVTASPLRSNSENVVQPVEVLAGEALDDRRAGTLGETLSSVLGVQTSFFGTGVGRPIIRGQEGARVQVLSEGIGSLDASTTRSASSPSSPNRSRSSRVRRLCSMARARSAVR